MFSAASMRWLPTLMPLENTTWSMCQVWLGSEGMGILPNGKAFLMTGRWNLQALQPYATILAKLKMDPSVGL